MEGCRGVPEGGKLQIVNLASRSPDLPARGWRRDTAWHIPAPGFVPPGPGCGAERASPGVWDVPIAEPDQWQDFSAAKKRLVTCQLRCWDFFKLLFYFLKIILIFFFLRKGNPGEFSFFYRRFSWLKYKIDFFGFPSNEGCSDSELYCLTYD